MTLDTLFPIITDSIGRLLIANAKCITLPANTTIFYQGASCENYLLVIKGSVKVFTRAMNGREIVLYRVTDGQSCTLTTTCLLANNNYPAEGVTETPVEALVIPIDDFNKGLAESDNFRTFVFNTYGKRLCDIINLVGEVSFNRIDIRLANYLLKNFDHNKILIVTHQTLATELGTAREVISRQLKVFEEKKWLQLNRGEISLINIEQINILAKTPLV